MPTSSSGVTLKMAVSEATGSTIASFRTEVIVHNLLHLKVPNHGGLFKALLRAHLNGGGDNGCK